MSVFLFLLQLALILLISRWLLQFSRGHLPSYFFMLGLCYKIMAGWGIGWLYMSYYEGGDTLNYYQDSLELSRLFQENPHIYLKALIGWADLPDLRFSDQPRALFFVKVSSLVSIFSLNNYWIMAFSFSSLSFLTSWWFIIRLKQLFSIKNYQLLVSFVFFPSFAFWSAGLLKESLAMILIFILIGHTLSLYYASEKRKLTGHLFLLIVASIVLWELKYYYAAVLLPMILLLFFLRLLKAFLGPSVSKNTVAFSSLVVLASLVLISMQLHPNLQPQWILKAIVRNHDLTVAASLGRGYVDFSGLEPTLISFFWHYPKAVFSGLFSPILLIQGYSFLHVLAGIENFLILILSLWAVYSLIFKKGWQLRHAYLVTICLLYIFLLSGLIALASPNFGSLLRYRVAYEPFWVLLMLLSVGKKRAPTLSQSRKNT